MDLSDAELLRFYPELTGCFQPVTDQEFLAQLLRRVGKSLEKFTDLCPKIACDEEVTQELIGSNGKTTQAIKSKYRYLMSVLSGALLEESRVNKNGEANDMPGMELGFMLTSGFISNSLLFHPIHQPESRFRYVGRAVMPRSTKFRKNKDGPLADIVAFSQKPDEAKMAGLFGIPGQTAVILMQGLAWIDRDKGQIVRMVTDLLGPNDIGLEMQRTEIDLAEVHIGKPSRAVWLPKEVVVAVVFQGAKYRNRERRIRPQFVIQTQI